MINSNLPPVLQPTTSTRDLFAFAIRHLRSLRLLTHPNPFSTWRLHVACQLDKSRVEKEFISKSSVPNTETRLSFTVSKYN